MILLIIAALILLVGLAAVASVAISKHQRTVKERNSEFHRTLLVETEERLLRFRPTHQGFSS